MPDLPPIDESRSFSLHLRQNEDLVPGVPGIPLPDCPPKDESAPFSLDWSQNEDLVPGVTCNAVSIDRSNDKLPLCPALDSKIDVRSNDLLIPGHTCTPLPPCPDLPSDNSGTLLDIKSSGDELIPGENVMNF